MFLWKIPYSMRNEWLQYFREIKRHWKKLWKKTFLRLNTVIYTAKHFFRNKLLWITAFSYELLSVCFFSIYKVIGWNPANIYLHKVYSRNTSGRCQIAIIVRTIAAQRGLVSFLSCLLQLLLEDVDVLWECITSCY